MRISDEGFIVYTGGRFLVHAVDHATDDPVSRPVDFPVTPENPGKLAAHHVLVEEVGGFAVPNQPYRLTLDDGQVIQGVTNELGELQMATSNAVSFGMIELMSQSAPDNVIGVASTSVFRDKSLPPPSASLPARTVQVGGKTATTPETGATSEAQPPVYLTCDPMNFGLRTYRYSGKEKEHPASEFIRKDVEYPVAKAYAAGVKKTLTAIDWVRLRSSGTKDVQDTIATAVQDPLNTALQSGVFGLPGAAMPAITLVTQANTEEINIPLDGERVAAFTARLWGLGITQTTNDRLFAALGKIDEVMDDDYKLKIARVAFDGQLCSLAKTIYHEARHCQQKFWMLSLLGTYPDDYKKFKSVNEFESAVVRNKIYALATHTRFPDDERVRLGMHRMLVFDYYWSLRNSTNLTDSMRGDLPVAEAEVCKMRNVSPEQAQQMAKHKPGYRSHYHEEDAYATEYAVEKYWGNPGHPFLLNPGVCTTEYAATLRQLGVEGNG